MCNTRSTCTTRTPFLHRLSCRSHVSNARLGGPPSAALVPSLVPRRRSAFRYGSALAGLISCFLIMENLLKYRYLVRRPNTILSLLEADGGLSELVRGWCYYSSMVSLHLSFFLFPLFHASLPFSPSCLVEWRPPSDTPLLRESEDLCSLPLSQQQMWLSKEEYDKSVLNTGHRETCMSLGGSCAVQFMLQSSVACVCLRISYSSQMPGSTVVICAYLFSCSRCSQLEIGHYFLFPCFRQSLVSVCIA